MGRAIWVVMPQICSGSYWQFSLEQNTRCGGIQVYSLKSFSFHPVNVDDYLKWFSHINHFDSTKSVTIQGPGRQRLLNLLPISWELDPVLQISTNINTIFVLVALFSGVQCTVLSQCGRELLNWQDYINTENMSSLLQWEDLIYLACQSQSQQ